MDLIRGLQEHSLRKVLRSHAQMPNDSGGNGTRSPPTNFEAFPFPIEELSRIQPTPKHVIAGSSQLGHIEAHSWTDNGSLVWVISSVSSITPLTPCMTLPTHVPQSAIVSLQGDNSSTIDAITSTRLRIIEQEEDLRMYGLQYWRRVQRATEVIMGTFLLLGMALGLGSVLAINLGQSTDLGELELIRS